MILLVTYKIIDFTVAVAITLTIPGLFMYKHQTKLLIATSMHVVMRNVYILNESYQACMQSIAGYRIVQSLTG